MISKVRVLEKLSFSKMLNGLSAITKKITGANQQERTSNRAELEKMFEDWFLLYPNPTGKDDAVKEFEKVLTLTGEAEKEAFGEYTGKSYAEKVDMMKRAFISQHGIFKDVKYVPTAKKWLNGYRWQDISYC